MDHDLLRRAAEHLGSLAEDAKTTADLNSGRAQTRWMLRYGRLLRVAREVLEITNG